MNSSPGHDQDPAEDPFSEQIQLVLPAPRTSGLPCRRTQGDHGTTQQGQSLSFYNDSLYPFTRTLLAGIAQLGER